MPAATATTASLDADKEFVFGEADFERIRKLIYRHAGISLHDGKHAMVYSRVARRLRETGYKSFADYLRWLEQDDHSPEWQEFINALTTNLTSFFREGHHFTSLAQDLRAIGSRPLRIWCSASSTGEEPYSIAMTVVEGMGQSAPVEVIASDIDTRVLDKARRGVYSIESKGLSMERLKQHFFKGVGSNEGYIRVRPHLSKMIDFRMLNLMHDDWPLGEPFDIIFCRNVMIYFDNPTQRRVLERMHRVLRPKGLLYVGHSENFTESKDLFRLRGKTIYERV